MVPNRSVYRRTISRDEWAGHGHTEICRVENPLVEQNDTGAERDPDTVQMGVRGGGGGGGSSGLSSGSGAPKSFAVPSRAEKDSRNVDSWMETGPGRR